jgi:hypothetical protein
MSAHFCATNAFTLWFDCAVSTEVVKFRTSTSLKGTGRNNPSLHSLKWCATCQRIVSESNDYWDDPYSSNQPNECAHSAALPPRQIRTDQHKGFKVFEGLVHFASDRIWRLIEGINGDVRYEVGQVGLWGIKSEPNLIWKTYVGFQV